MHHFKGYHCALSLITVIAAHSSSSNAFAADLGCGYLECNGGCMVFRSDSGTVYQFAVPPAPFKGAHRVQITGTINASCTPLCSGSSGCIVTPVITACHSGSCMDTAADFKRGETINLSGGSGQLEINEWSETKVSDPPVLPYLWVACSQRGTVMRIAAVDHYSPVDGRCVSAGDLLGQYRTAPDSCRGILSDPSRTTVDFDGNVWVANKSDIQVGTNPILYRGHAAKFGNGLAFQWVDRNQNGVMDTSQFDPLTGQPNVLPWTNPDGVCTSGHFGIPGDPNAGDLQYAQDELILAYRVFDGNNQPFGTRTIAVDRSNNVWVGGNGSRWHEPVDGQTGQPVLPGGAVRTCGGYGGLVDCAGVLWSARGASNPGQVLRLPPTGLSSCINVSEAYGLAANTLGEIWNSMLGNSQDRKISSGGVAGTPTATTSPTAINYKGVVVTPEDDDVWTAAVGNEGSHTPPFAITRHSNAGTLRTTIQLDPLGKEPTGVAVDSRGFVWVTNKFSNNVMRINPTGGANGLGGVDLTVSLGTGAFPYNYSDMTGVNLYSTIAPAGVWTGVFDSGVAGKLWHSLTWTGLVGDGAIIVKVRAADTDYNLGKNLYQVATNGSFPFGTVLGRYLQVRVQLDARCRKPPPQNWVWPTVQSLVIDGDYCPPATINDTFSIPPNCVVDARYPHLPNNPAAKRGIGNPTSANPLTDKIRIQLGTPGAPVCGAAKTECWNLCETGGVNQNSITGRVHLGGGMYEIQLAQAITTGRASTIKYTHESSSDSITYFSHPANVNGNSQSNPADILSLIDYLNGIGTVPWGLYSCDIDHTNSCLPADIIGEIDMLNGTNGFAVWNGVNKPLTTPCADAGCSGMSLMAGTESGLDELEESNDAFANRTVEFLTIAQTDETTTVKDIALVGDALMQWCKDNLSPHELESLAARLEDPSLAFVDPEVRLMIPQFVSQLR